MHKEVWNNCLKIIKDNVPSISFRTWFEPIIPLRLENKVLTISRMLLKHRQAVNLSLFKKSFRSVSLSFFVDINWIYSGYILDIFLTVRFEYE